jgi:hypothetical protein
MPGDVFPRNEPRTSTSRAEVRIWEALRKSLPVGWTAWHSLKLRLGTRWEGEGDFVIAVPDRGLMVLEVKGGTIACKDGVWSQNGKKMRAPRDQAQGFIRGLVDRLEAQGVTVPSWGIACAFPDADFSDELGPSAGDLEGLVMGSRHIQWLGESLPAVFDRAVRATGTQAAGWIEAVHRLWCETWVPTVSLADEIRDAEAATVRLVDEQLAHLATAADNPRAIVTGGAGTGKTLLARELCLRATARGQRVRYFCFTDALAAVVDRGFAAARAAGADVRAQPIRRFAGELLAAAGSPQRDGDADFWATASLQAACAALPPVEARPDLVVVDEAQDLDAGDWALVSELAGPRGLWIFGDERQAFWRKREIPEALRTGAVRLKLGEQLRSPPQIAAFAGKYAAEAAAAAPTVATPAPAPAVAAKASAPVVTRPVAVKPGVVVIPPVRIIEVAAGDELARLTTEVAELIRGKARPQDIAILTLAGQAASAVLREASLGGEPLRRADHAEAATGLIADTFLRFKGLERPIVILVELAAGHASEYERRMHIASTRATAKLIVIATAEAIAKDPRLTTA